MIKTHKPYYPLYEDTEHFIYLITGGRGCERPTQKVMMADLSVKQIKDIKIGDKVMGDDGTPRTVINTYHGFGKMYEVWQSNGETYYVNDGHILTLFHIGRCKKVDIPIIEYIGLSEWEKRMMRGCNVSHELSLIEVKQIENGEWCGIHLDGNQRYVHSDGTVTHNSGKSFSAGTFIERLTFEYNKEKKISHQILFTRYTMVSANISVIPEFNEKIDLDGVSAYFHKSANDMVNTMTGSRVMFRGIHTSSGNQTAKLKSIQGITTFVVDEAEEWVNEEEFEKIMLSIRTKGLQNRVIIIMNPADSNHWVYRRFIQNSHKLVEYDGVPVQISTHPSVLHIHTSYLDNFENLSENFLKEVLAMKQNDPEKYAHVVMGAWSDVAAGAVFKKFGVCKEFPSYAKIIGRGIDFGYTNDPTAIVRCGVIGNALYLDELCYKTQMTSGDIIRELKREESVGDDGFVYAESADPRLIDEIGMGGVILYPVAKGAGSIQAGLSKMLDMQIFVTERSYNLQNEMRNYVWAKDKDGRYMNVPEDHDQHLIDAARYFVLHKIMGFPLVRKKVTKEQLGVY